MTGDRIAELVATTSISIKQRPASTAATMSEVESDAPLIDVDTEDSALILFRTANDIAGSAVITQLSAGRKNRLWVEIDGMQRSAVFDQELPEQLQIGADAGTQILVRDPNHGSPEQRRLSLLPAGHVQGFAQCFENYVNDSYAAIDAYNGEAESPRGLPTFADGARAAAICDAMLQSCAEQAMGESQLTFTIELAGSPAGISESAGKVPRSPAGGGRFSGSPRFRGEYGGLSSFR